MDRSIPGLYTSALFTTCTESSWLPVRAGISLKMNEKVGILICGGNARPLRSNDGPLAAAHWLTEDWESQLREKSLLLSLILCFFYTRLSLVNGIVTKMPKINQVSLGDFELDHRIIFCCIFLVKMTDGEFITHVYVRAAAPLHF